MSGEQDDDFARFVRDHSQALARTAFLLTGEAAQAEDLLQTALLKVLRRWPRLDDRINAEAYVRRVLVTTHASGWRRRWRGEVPSAAVPDLGGNDETTIVDQRHLLLWALSQLPRRQRAAVVLRHYDGLSEADTAEVLGCASGTVKSQTARGLAKLRQLLDEAPAAAPDGGTQSAIEKERAP